MTVQRTAATTPDLKKDDLIVITGAGGFIAGSLTRYFHDQGFTRIRAIDKKPLSEWYQRVPGVESLCMDVSEKENAIRACEGAVEVYNLAADMGGMGFIERFRVECLRSILINDPHDRSRLPGRGAALFLLFFGLRLQHHLAAGPSRPGSQGIGCLPGHGRARLRLGEADV